MREFEPRRRDLHEDQPVLADGVRVERAKGVMVLLHGRGGSANDMLSLVPLLKREDFMYLAPQASGNAWYPNTFLADLESNEPWLSAALNKISGILQQVSHAGITTEQIFLLGFSQGACLALEFVARNPQRFGAVAGLSGGLIGPPGTPRDYPGQLSGTPVFLGCSERDPHIPLERVKETTQVLAGMGAEVSQHIYPGSSHTITETEIESVRRLQDVLVKFPER
jgi:predicted esterase